MDDLFEREQKILDHALAYLETAQRNNSCTIEEYTLITKEYRKLLKQVRRITKISDRTTINLNASKQDLLDKVCYDELTGIYNRRFLDENLLRIFKSLTFSNGFLGLLMIDVDFFKKYNDTYGHSKGDDCLRMIAEAIRESILRPEDFAARYGGEEFVAVLPDTEENGARIIAERILENVRNRQIPHRENTPDPVVTVSIGATTGTVFSVHQIKQFLIKADQALYVSKRTGRNRYTFLQCEEEK